MDLYDGETILFEGHPSWRSALIFFVQGFLIAVIVGAALWFAVAHWAGVLGLVAVVVLTIAISVVVRSATDYAITNERLHIRRGIVSRKIQETRLGRVQNVTVNQTIWERILFIGRAEFDTASDQENDFVFAGIANPDQVRAAVDKAHRLAEQASAAEQRSSGQL